MPKFQCLKCGYCCRHLLNEVDFGLAGLFLLPEETKLFPKDKIFPLYGFGIKGRSRPRPIEIGMYQYAEMTCIHLTQDNLCKIYDKRPLICRAFPLEVSPFGGCAHRECTAIKGMLREWEFVRVEELFDDPEIQANIAINERLLQMARKYFPKVLWAFDLKTKKWKRLL